MRMRSRPGMTPGWTATNRSRGSSSKASPSTQKARHERRGAAAQFRGAAAQFRGAAAQLTHARALAVAPPPAHRPELRAHPGLPKRQLNGVIPAVRDLLGCLTLVLKYLLPNRHRLRVTGPLRHAAQQLVRSNFSVLLDVPVAGEPPGRVGRDHRARPLRQAATRPPTPLALDTASPWASIRCR